MSASTQAKKAARAYAEKHGVKYTTALRAVAAETSATPASAYPELAVGQRIRFAEYRTSMIVRAISTDGRFAVLTQKFFGKLVYTVMDLALGIRGTSSSYDIRFTTDGDCQELVRSFERRAEIDENRDIGRNDAGELLSEVSYRNWVWLRYTDSQPDKRTEAMVPELRALTYAAPPRTYNDHRNPRTALEQAMHQPSGTVMLAHDKDDKSAPRLAIRHQFVNPGRNNGKGGWLLADEPMDDSAALRTITEDGVPFRQLLPVATAWVEERASDDDDELDDIIEEHEAAARQLIDRSTVGTVLLFGRDAVLKISDNSWMATTCGWSEDGEEKVAEWFKDRRLEVVGPVRRPHRLGLSVITKQLVAQGFEEIPTSEHRDWLRNLRRTHADGREQSIMLWRWKNVKSAQRRGAEPAFVDIRVSNDGEHAGTFRLPQWEAGTDEMRLEVEVVRELIDVLSPAWELDAEGAQKVVDNLLENPRYSPHMHLRSAGVR